MAEDLNVIVEDDVETIRVDPVTGTIEEDQPDGSVIVKLDAIQSDQAKKKAKWFRNLVEELDDSERSLIVNELLEAIAADDNSRSGKLADIARGIELLGLKIEEPKSDTEGGGISSVTNPLLLESILRSWANSQAELLPAAGPCKIKDSADSTAERDELAERLEEDTNYFLTKTATEYYPSTSNMLLWGTHLTGSGFKKVYRCPLKRRPTSEVVKTENLIVSDTASDFGSCARITHKITMRTSVYKRMVLAGAYVAPKGETDPSAETDPVKEAVAGVQGTVAMPSRPEDQPYTIYEAQCELDLDQFIPKGSPFKGKGVPLPYLVSIEKDSQQLIAIRRDWEEQDETCRRLRLYVKYPYVPGPGFYDTGLLNILGNCSAAMTAAWREALDAGMYANFPSGLVAKSIARQQNSMTLRAAPGEFATIDTGGKPIRDMVMEMPFQDVTPGLMTLIEKITEQAQRVGQSAEIPVGEGMQNVPVGTMLASIEQATKVMAAAHKGMHVAQGEEIDMIIDLFRRNPEDFWRDNKDAPANFWDAEKLIKALNTKRLVPVSDPNVPSHIHRLMKVMALIDLYKVFPELRRDVILRRALAVLHEDFNDLVDKNYKPPLAADPVAAAKMMDAQAKEKKIASDEKIAMVKIAGEEKELASKERIAEMQITEEVVRSRAEAERQAMDDARDREELGIKMQIEDRKEQREAFTAERKLELEERKVGVAAIAEDHKQKKDVASHVLELARAAHEAAVSTHEALNPPKPASAAKAKAKPKKK